MTAHNLDMWLTQGLMRVIAPGLAAGIIGTKPKEAQSRLGKTSARHKAIDQAGKAVEKGRKAARLR